MTTTRLPSLAAAAALLGLALTGAAQQPVHVPPDRGTPLREWLIVGTFPTDTGAARVARAYLPGEGALTPAPGEAAVAGKAWRAVTADSFGRLNFNQLFPDQQRENAVVYALTYLWSPADTTVTMGVESDDDVMVWLDGLMVHRNEVARGVGNGPDTLVLRLARGYNRLLYKVANRSGGFGMGGRLVSLAGEAVPAGLRAIAARPAASDLARAATPAITMGPVSVGAAARLNASPAGSPLLVPVDVTVRRWGGITTPVSVAVGTRQTPVPPARDGEAGQVRVEVAWTELAGAVATGVARVEARAGRTLLAAMPLPAAADQLLTLLSRPIALSGWQGSHNDPAAAGTPGGAPWFPIESAPDSAGRAAVGSLALIGRVPAALGGLTLDMEAAEFLPEARITVNGRQASADSIGRVALCAPCTADGPLQVVIGVRGGQWWDLPRLRVRDPGWAEIRDGARWARELGGDPAVQPPDSSVARAMLAAALTRDKAQYLGSVGEWMARLAPAAARARGDTLRLTGNSHIDAAWLWRRPETIDVVRNTWRTAAKLMRKYPEMKFAASSAQYFVWLEQHEPGLLRRVQELDRQGRWALVGGWWVEPDANMPSGESLVRQGLYGQRTFQRLFGHTATVGWIPDTFGYPWTLPQILKKSGMTSFVTQKLHWNDLDPWPASLEQFWWEGPDGSRVLAYIPFGYDSDLSPGPLAKQWQATKDSAAVPAMLTLYGVGDHGGGPTAEMLDQRRDLERVPTFPALREQEPAEALRDIGAALARKPTAPAFYPGGGPQPRGAAPVLRDELYLEYHRGVFTTQAGIKADNRRMEALLAAAEAAATSATAGLVASAASGQLASAAGSSTAGAFTYPAADLTRAWEMMLFNQFHDLLAGSGIGEIYADAASDYHVADSLATSALERALRALAARLDTRPPRPGLLPVIIFNPSPHPRTGIVRIAAAAGVDAALDANGGRLPAARDGDTLAIEVEGVPPLGIAVVFAGPAGATGRGRRAALPARPRLRAGAQVNLPTAARGARVLENAYLRVDVDPRTGNIARLYDKRLQREVLQPGANALVLIEDRPKDWDAWNIDNLDGARTPVEQDVTVGAVTRDALGRSLVVQRSAPGAKVRQTLFLPERAARLEVETDVDWSASHQLMKAVFPLAFRADSSWAEIPYGVIARPTRPITRRDSARFEVPMLRWVEATVAPSSNPASAGVPFGFAVANDSKYAYDAHGDTLRITLLRSPKSPDLRADMGRQHFRYALVPHAGDYRAQPLEAAVEALNEPMHAITVAASTGTGAARSLAGPVSAAGTAVTVGAVKRAEDGGALVIRLAERHGRATTAVVRVPGASALEEIDLLERPLRPAASVRGDAGVFRIPMRAWEIRTFRASGPAAP